MFSRTFLFQLKLGKKLASADELEGMVTDRLEQPFELTQFFQW